MHLSAETAVLLFGGLLVAIIGWIWLAVVAFRTGVRWGLAAALFPTFAAPCLALDHWKQIRFPMLVHYGGILLILIARMT